MTTEGLREQIEEAEMIVVGIGSELRANKILPYDDQQILDYFKAHKKTMYSYLIKEAGNREELAYLRELYYAYYILKKEAQLQSPYEILADLLKDKNYFIITSNPDDLIYTSSLKKERITAPCGTYRYFQCSKGCSQSLYPAIELIEAKIQEYEEKDDKSQIACGKCKAPLEFNIRTKENATHYIEQAYLPQWNCYTKWLQGTLNRKFLVLELGEGFSQPSLFRWPFERMVYFNEKARFIRVHKKLSQVGEELKGKAKAVPKSALEFLKEL